jgi:hypothetical protein
VKVPLLPLITGLFLSALKVTMNATLEASSLPPLANTPKSPLFMVARIHPNGQANECMSFSGIALQKYKPVKTILAFLFGLNLIGNAFAQSARPVFIVVTAEYRWADGIASPKGYVELVIGADRDNYFLWSESGKQYPLPKPFGQIITAEDAALRLVEHRQSLYNEIVALNQKLGNSPQVAVLGPAAQPVYISKIEESKDNVLKLTNGAVIEITRGYLGSVGLRKGAVLYKEGKNWSVWIEGKRTYPCNILKAPENHPPILAEVISISEVKGNGKILSALDGSLFEVGELSELTTSLWLGPFEALLINGDQLLNLNEGDGIIDVEKIK